MKKSIKTVICAALALLIALPVFSGGGGVALLKRARAAVVESEPVVQDFNGDALGQEWTLTGDAELREGKTTLRINKPNAWQPALTVLNHKVENKASVKAFSVEMDTEFIDGGGWIGLPFGTLAKTGHFYESGFMFMIDHEKKATLYKTNNAGGIVPVVGSKFDLPLLNKGKKVSLRLEGTKNYTNTDATTNALLHSFFDIKVFTSTDGAPYEEHKLPGTLYAAENVLAAGHFGICSMSSITADITRYEFKLFEGDGAANNVPADIFTAEPSDSFSGDFKTQRVAYTSSSAGYEWGLSATAVPLECYYMGTLKDVKVTNGAIAGAYPFEIDSRLDNFFDISFDITAGSFSASSRLGVGFGLAKADSALDSANMVYIKGAGAGVELGVLKNGTESSKISVPSGLTAPLNLSFKGYYKNLVYNVAVYGNGVKIGEFTNLTLDGYYSIGAVSSGTDVFLIDNISVREYVYKAAEARNETIDFKGVRKQTVAGEEIDRPFYNTSKWYVGGVGAYAPRFLNNQIRQFFEFNVLAGANTASGAPPAFGPAYRYGDFIMRYNISDIDAGSSFIGVSFGKSELSSVNSSAAFIKFEKQGDGMKISCSDGGTPVNTIGGLASVTDAQNSFFAGAEKSYDVMIVVNSGRASVYYSEAGKNELIGRAEFEGLSTYGYLSLSGDAVNAFKYRVNSFSVTNIGDSYFIDDEKLTATNLSEFELNDIAQIGFSNAYLNETRWALSPQGVSIADGVLKIADASGQFSSKGQFENFQLNLDLASIDRSADFSISFGKSSANPAGYSIKFLAGTADAELIGLSDSKNRSMITLPVNIYDISGIINIKLSVTGKKVALSIKRGDSPVSELLTPVAELKFIGDGAAEKGAVSFSAKGAVTLDNIRIVSLNYGIDIITENFGGTNKPPMTNLEPEAEDDDKFPVWAIVLIAAGGAVVLGGAGFAVYMLVSRRKKK